MHDEMPSWEVHCNFYSPLHGLAVGRVEGHHDIALDPVLLVSMTYSSPDRLHITEERILRTVGTESGDVASAHKPDGRVNIRLTLNFVYASFLWTTRLRADIVVGVQPSGCWTVASSLFLVFWSAVV
jgi:hypothetical protein